MSPNQKKNKKPQHDSNKKKDSKPKLKDDDEKQLEAMLFGDLGYDMWDNNTTDPALNDSLTESNNKEDVDEQLEEEGDEPAFFFDSGPIQSESNETNDIDIDEKERDGSDDDSDDNSEEDSEEDQVIVEYQQKAAWKDDDDALLQVSLANVNRLRKLRKHEDEDIISGAEYERRLRKQFHKIYPVPTWAQLPSDKKDPSNKRKLDNGDSSDNDEDDDIHLNESDRLDLLKSTLGILDKRNKSAVLSPDFLSIARLKNANVMAPSKKTIKSLQFHPNAQVLLAAGLDSTLRLFQIDGKVNHKIQSVYFKDTPIHRAQFHSSGDQILITGQRKHIYIYDVQSGKVDKSPGIWGRDEKSWENFSISPCGRYIAFAGINGHIVLVSYKTKQQIGSLRMNDRVECLDWSADGNYLYSSGHDGVVYQWDIGQRECTHKWVDDGSLGTTALAVSPNENYYATGSTSGIVNIYGVNALTNDNERPQPYKTITNLTKQISQLHFNFDSQILAASCSSKRDQLKLIHVPTGRVFVNWPTEKTPLGHVSSVAFSPNSEYIAIGNKQGRALLYNIKDYALV
ncbi:unnamed protein product [Cunninghamella blakesleeana]